MQLTIKPGEVIFSFVESVNCPYTVDGLLKIWIKNIEMMILLTIINSEMIVYCN